MTVKKRERDISRGLTRERKKERRRESYDWTERDRGGLESESLKERRIERE